MLLKGVKVRDNNIIESNNISGWLNAFLAIIFLQAALLWGGTGGRNLIAKGWELTETGKRIQEVGFLRWQETEEKGKIW